MPVATKREWIHNGAKKSAWIVRYVDYAGTKKQKTFKTKKDADRCAFQIDSDIRSGVRIAEPRKQTLAFICDEFLKHQEDRQRQGSIGRGRYENLKKLIDRNVVTRFGKRKISEISPLDIETWFHALIREDAYTPQTARLRLGDLGQFFKFAVKRGYVVKNPVTEMLPEIGRIDQVRVKTFDIDMIRALLLAANERLPKMVEIGSFKRLGKTIEAFQRPTFSTRERTFLMRRCMVHLAAFCGLRLGEILALRLQHIDFGRGVIEVRHSMTPWAELKGPKTKAGVRDIPMPLHLAALLQDFISRAYRKNELGLLFDTTHGNFRQDMWKPLLKQAGLYREHLSGKNNQIHFHALRHFAASAMLGVLPVTEVPSLMGHSNLDMTLRVYAHAMISPAGRTQALQQMAIGILPPVSELIEGTAKRVEKVS